MALVLLILSLFIIFLFSYLLFNKDIFSPTVLFTGFYLVSAFCTFYNIKTWGVDLHYYTVLIILLGIISFAIAEFLVKYINRNSEKSTLKINTNAWDYKEIRIEKYKIVIIIIVNIVITYMLYKEIIRIANLNYQSWGNLIYNYKTNSQNESLTGSSLSPLVTQVLKITKGFAYVFLFIFINNMYCRVGTLINRFRRNFVYLVPALFLCAHSLLKGVRIAIIALIIAGVFMAYFWIQNKKGWTFKFKIKNIVYSVVSVMLVLFIFYQVKEIFGRQQEDLGVIGYVTTYLGASIQLFDQYLYNNSYVSFKTIETFSGLVSSLQKLGMFSNITVLEQPEFRYSPTGLNIGNVYGAVRGYYHDFGIFGVVGCFFVMSTVLNTWYIRLKSKISINSKSLFSFILYSTLVYGVVFLNFYVYITAKVSIGFIVEMIILWFCIKFIFNFRIK